MHLSFKILGFISVIAALLWFQSAARAPKKASAPQSAATQSAATQSAAQLVNASQPETTAMPERIITDFTQGAAEAEQWRNVDDTVMGGVSQGEMIMVAQSTGVFEGTLSLENNGGFSSVRRDTSDYDFSGVESISARVKGDGRRYQLRLQTREADRVTYRAEFATTAGEWQVVSVPLADFEPVFRGNIVESAPPLDAEGIYQVGFLIADKKSGDFKLEVDWIGVE